MRPLKLRLSGLHSYREEVTIDFTALGQFGLFGIFGDIGSGKSTILDGITLALYGVIDRVHGRSRRGIVNHHVDRIDVTFRFAVGDVYEVQRSYKRDTKGVAQRVASRIGRVESCGSLSVIADKEREVNDTVQNLLGLTSDDFMRAVVLPQGRFMEFLHLKGSERRAMLQRIFRLSAYGEGLRAQLRDERERCTLTLETHRGELRGLGDASPDAVAAAGDRRAASEESLSSRQSEFSRLEASYATAADGRQRQLAFLRAETLLNDHIAGKEAILAAQSRLQRAETAHLVSEPAEAWMAARSEARDAKAAEIETAAAHASACAHQINAVASARQARDQLAARAPELRRRVSRLERAALLAGQLSAVEAEATRIEAERATDNAYAASLEARNAEHVQQLSALSQRRTSLSAEFSQCQIPSDTREQLLAASRAHRELTRRQGEAAEIRTEITRLNEDGNDAGMCPTCGSSLSIEARREHLDAELERARRAELDGWSLFDRDSGGLTFFDVPHRLRDLATRDRRATEIYPALQDLQQQISRLRDTREATATELASARQGQALSAGRARSLAEQRSEILVHLRELGEDGDVNEIAQRRDQAISTRDSLQDLCDRTTADETRAQADLSACVTAAAVAKTHARACAGAQQQTRRALDAVLRSSGLGVDADLGAIRDNILEPEVAHAMCQQVGAWHDALAEREAALRLARQAVPTEVLADTEWASLAAAFATCQGTLDVARTEATTARLREEELLAKAGRYTELHDTCRVLDLRLGRLVTLSRVLRGNRFIEYMANDYLEELAIAANHHLATLTADRYALQLDEDGSFLVRDEDGGGALRPVTSLSGGETFVASLALALALSSQVQERSAQPLELFFLDEGFGTLDGEALDRVMTAIESLQSDVRTIGVISHVPAVRERVPRYVMVAQPGRDGTGSRLSIHDN